MDYQYTKDGSIYVPVPIGEGKLLFRAEGVRKERTGIHARIEIYWNKVRLAYDQFNVERRADRANLMGHAYKLLQADHPEAADLITKDQAVLELDMFCADLWQAHVGSVTVDIDMPGDITIPPPRMLGPYVIDEGGTIIHGQPGAGKSWLLYLICQSINHGCSTVWPIRKQERVLLINLERSAQSVQQRLGCINRALGLPNKSTLDILNFRGHTLRDVADAARKHVERYGIGVVALDSVSRAGLGSMNKDEVANEIIDVMNSIGPTWVALAHQAKPSPEAEAKASIYGNNMFYGGVDLSARLESEPSGEDLLVTVQIDKANIRIDRKPVTYLFQMDNVGLLGISEAPAGLSDAGQVIEMLAELGTASIPYLAEMLNFSESKVRGICETHPDIRFAGADEQRQKTYRLST